MVKDAPCVCRFVVCLIENYEVHPQTLTQTQRKRETYIHIPTPYT